MHFAGTALGCGVYFAANASTSLRFCHDHKIILAKVVVGKYCRGQPRMGWEAVAQMGCHSTVDDVYNPKVFVVYHDAAAYPEYIVTFEDRRDG